MQEDESSLPNVEESDRKITESKISKESLDEEYSKKLKRDFRLAAIGLLSVSLISDIFFPTSGSMNFCLKLWYQILGKMMGLSIRDLGFDPSNVGYIINFYTISIVIWIFPLFLKRKALKKQINVVPQYFTCPNCSTKLELEENERLERKFSCPNCNKNVNF